MNHQPMPSWEKPQTPSEHKTPRGSETSKKLQQKNPPNLRTANATKPLASLKELKKGATFEGGSSLNQAEDSRNRPTAKKNKSGGGTPRG